MFIVIGILVLLGGMASANIVEIVEYHYLLANEKTTNMLTDTNANSSIQNLELFGLFSAAETFLKQDIPSLLQSGDRGVVLNNYLSEGEAVQAGIDRYTSSLTSEAKQAKSKLQACEGQLQKANTQYASALKENSEFDFLQAVESAKNARSCMGEYYVVANSVEGLQSKLKSYQDALAKRITYLRNNQALITEHYNMLNPALLNQLNAVANTLEASRR